MIITGGQREHRYFVKLMFDDLTLLPQPCEKVFGLDKKTQMWRLDRYSDEIEWKLNEDGYYYGRTKQGMARADPHKISYDYNEDIKQIIEVNFGAQDSYPTVAA